MTAIRNRARSRCCTMLVSMVNRPSKRFSASASRMTFFRPAQPMSGTVSTVWPGKSRRNRQSATWPDVSWRARVCRRPSCLRSNQPLHPVVQSSEVQTVLLVESLQPQSTGPIVVHPPRTFAVPVQSQSVAFLLHSPTLSSPLGLRPDASRLPLTLEWCVTLQPERVNVRSESCRCCGEAHALSGCPRVRRPGTSVPTKHLSLGCAFRERNR